MTLQISTSNEMNALAVIPAGACLPGGQVCRRGPGGPGGQRAEHEPAVSPSSSVGREHPVLY